jgi:antitoxin component YwqK of YwqJK toxin-antitoxin module
MFKQILFTVFIIHITFQSCFAQQPPYTKKHFASVLDTAEFKRTAPVQNGLVKTYILTQPEIWDVDDNNTTHVLGGGTPAVLCIEGTYKGGLREGVFTFYLIDSMDHSKRYKLWEQQYTNDQLNGTWKTYNLKGIMVNLKSFTNDSLNGISRDYWIDGRSIMEEREYFGGQRKFIQRNYYQHDNIIQSEQTFVDGVPNGVAKRYYQNGTIEEEANFKNGQLHGVRKYYHPNGKIWIATEWKEDKPWTVLANYDSKGAKRNAGTLKSGNGTLIFYEPDGSIRETITYKEGLSIK